MPSTNFNNLFVYVYKVIIFFWYKIQVMLNLNECLLYLKEGQDLDGGALELTAVKMGTGVDSAPLPSPGF